MSLRVSGLALNREWRLRAMAAAPAGVWAVAAPAWYLRAVAPVDAYFAHPIYPDQVFAALLAGALVAIAGWQAFVAVRERERARLRAAAIAYLLTPHAVVGLIGFPVCLVVMVLTARGTIGDSFWMIPPS